MPSDLRQDYLRIRAFSYTWLLPVTWQRRRSHHLICCMQTSWLYASQNWSYCWRKFYVAEIGFLDLCCCCDLDLDLMIFIYKLDPYSLETYILCVRIWTSYIKAFESYHLIDIQTYIQIETRPKQYTIPLRRWSIISRRWYRQTDICSTSILCWLHTASTTILSPRCYWHWDLYCNVIDWRDVTDTGTYTVMLLTGAARQPLFWVFLSRCLSAIFFYLTWRWNGSADFDEIQQARPSKAVVVYLIKLALTLLHCI